jgi:hypothetical protein
MRQLARLLLVMTSFLWLLAGLLPVEARSCASTMQEARCCLAQQPNCAMDCCRVPGNLSSDAATPARVSLQQLSAPVVFWRTPELLVIKAVHNDQRLSVGLEAECRRRPQEKIYLLKRALLI